MLGLVQELGKFLKNRAPSTRTRHSRVRVTPSFSPIHAHASTTRTRGFKISTSIQIPESCASFGPELCL